MAQYLPTYVPPKFRKEEQDGLKTNDEFKKLKVVPIKAALNYQTSSPTFDPLIEKFINYVMEGGRKELSRSLIEQGFEKIKRMQVERWNKAAEEEKSSIETNPRILFRLAVENARPLLRLKPVKRGGITYQVPTPLTEHKSYFMGMKWIIEASNDKFRTIHFPEKFAFEIIDAANNTGRVVNRKIDLHRQCEANRAYAHYRWQ